MDRQSSRPTLLRWAAAFLAFATGPLFGPLSPGKAGAEPPQPKDGVARPKPGAEARANDRDAMVALQISARGITDGRLIRALRKVPRHLFVPEAQRSAAYADHPLPIGWDQTISQPYIVALMTDLLDVSPKHRVLEIGTGSGYQAAILAELVSEVYTIEIVEPLAARAKQTLQELGYENVTVIAGDGYRGLVDKAPFDRIIVTAAPERIPEPLIEQLAIGGRMVIPVGGDSQELRVIEKTKRGVVEKSGGAVRFVPMTGEIQKKPKAR